ncbi:hypothetical protein RRG08_013887 [Elysia crispata]|uniref:Uncharacterized protein n=1 Tax=Elysia crispata TaxID=231223 RepID=A0AAE1D0P1_9GAST|nr:hypothetical protein RRG08_013887 [Elysia crispata]
MYRFEAGNPAIYRANVFWLSQGASVEITNVFKRAISLFDLVVLIPYIPHFIAGHCQAPGLAVAVVMIHEPPSPTNGTEHGFPRRKTTRAGWVFHALAIISPEVLSNSRTHGKAVGSNVA